MSYLERFRYWLMIMSPLMCQVHGPEWRITAHCFNLAACRPDGSGLFPRPSSGRRLNRKDIKGKLIRAGHTAERWLTAKDCAEAIAQYHGPFHVLLWSPRILVIDCDSVQDSDNFKALCDDKGIDFAFEPSNSGGHFLFERLPRRWPSIFTNAQVKHKDNIITIDSCFGPKWEEGGDILYTDDGEPVSTGGHYETGGRVLKTAICKACWDPSKIVCNAPVGALDSRELDWVDNPYKPRIEHRRSSKRDYKNTPSVSLAEGERNVGLCRLLGAQIKRNSDLSYDDRLNYLVSINNNLPNPLPEQELTAIVRSSFRWR